MLMPNNIQRWLTSLLTSALLLSACSSSPPKSALTTPVSSLHGKGYESEIFTQEHVTHAQWEHGDERLNVSLHVPAQPGHFPLVIYLPGLGDSADDAASLQSQWAQSGYAVLSIQSARTGPAVFGSASARTGDFRALAAQNYTRTALQQRLDQLDWVVLELIHQQKTASPDSENFSRISTDDIVIAGFDIGAQTAQAIGGEALGEIKLPDNLRNVRGLILLSPYAEFGGAPFNTRYQKLQLPVLTVSSPEDVDAFDFATNPALRRHVFESIPAGNKYSLELSYASHEVIGGGHDHSSLFGPREDPDTKRSSSGQNRRGPPGGGGPGGGASGGPSGGSGGGPGGGGMPSAKPSGDGPGDRAEGKLPEASGQEDQSSILRAVTLAYLDATLRQDDIAVQWLYRDANRWMNTGGKLYLR
jgi:uncharacterized membrane protein YgcG